MKYHIAFFIDSIDFTKEDAALKSPKGLGGSESALIMTANALAKRGHEVTMFSTKFHESFARGGKVNGVSWYKAERLQFDYAVVDFDVFISQRQLYPFFFNTKYPTLINKPRFNIIWHEDYIMNHVMVEHALAAVDANFFVSEWQRDNFADKVPYIRKNSFVTKNAIDIDWINKYSGKVEKNPYKLIVFSRPERSIENIVPIFKRMKEKVPELELNICRYYSMYEPSPDMKSVLDYHDRLIQGVDGIKFLGNLSKDELYYHIASSKFVTYATNFDETSCIAAIESQALGTPMITTNRGALQETLHDNAGVKIDGDARSEEYIQKFIDSVFELMEDDEKYSSLVEAGLEHAKQYDAGVIAEEWERYLDTRFERRFNSAKQKVYDNLIYFDDVLAAEYLVDNYPKEVTPIPQREVTPIEEFNEFSNPLPDDGLCQDVRYQIANEVMMKNVKKDSGRVLDFACGNGSFIPWMLTTLHDYDIVAIDKSKGLAKRTSEFFDTTKNVEVICGSLEKIQGEFDFIFCGEFLEHARNYMEVLETFESHLSDYGIVIFTVPAGPISRTANPDPLKQKENHVIHWTLDDIKHVFGEKPGFDVSAYHNNDFDKRGDIAGHFVISYKKGGRFKPLDFEKKIKTFPPRQTLSVGIATKDSQKWIRNAIESIKDIADEIVVVDNGSADKTVEIVSEYTNKIHKVGKCPYVPEDTPSPGAFDWLNNEVLKHCSGDWFMKLDSDEELVSSEKLRKYLRYDSYHDGYNIKQVHLQQDKGIQFDLPVRLFRNNGKYKYYGVLHEQPQKVTNINRSIYPHLILEDVNIAHYGYLTEKHRQGRAVGRNIRLMQLDREINPDRELGHLLWIRESINIARTYVFQGDEHMAGKILKDALEEWRKYFSDPMHRLYKVGIDEVYKKLLDALGIGAVAKLNINGTDFEFKYDREEYVAQYVNALMTGFKNELWDEFQEEYLTVQKETEVMV